MTIFLLIIFSIICPFLGIFISSSSVLVDFLNCNEYGMAYTCGYIFGAIHLFVILLAVAKMGVFIK